MVDARVMRVLASLLILSCLLGVTAVSESEKEKLRVLKRNNLFKLDISAESKAEFKSFMGAFCLTTLSAKDFLNNYILWEGVEFLDGVRDFLDPMNTDQGAVKKYFHHIGHEFTNNCTKKDHKKIAFEHDVVKQKGVLENFLYDQMTRSEWTTINL
ncbi:unnamed protein product [Caenorhabditis sp. 36 PRJEB53466]|nr:unnamed protein product [Caenorhabditis sp. 36 PRJEB53466]